MCCSISASVYVVSIKYRPRTNVRTYTWIHFNLQPHTDINYVVKVLLHFYSFVRSEGVERCQKWSNNITQQIDLALNIFFMVYFFIRVSTIDSIDSDFNRTSRKLERYFFKAIIVSSWDVKRWHNIIKPIMVIFIKNNNIYYELSPIRI